MLTLKQLAVDSLTHLAEGGRERLAVDDEARAILRRWMQDARRGSAPVAEQAEVKPKLKAEAQPEMSVEEKLAYLQRRAVDWKPAKRLGTFRDTVVFAAGNPHARLMLVGDAPGAEEERRGEPFVGPAGQLLTRILAAMGLQRSEVYMTNVCKFRMAVADDSAEEDRAPTGDELAVFQPLIEAEVRAVQPACIVCLGGKATKGLLGISHGVRKLRGRWYKCQGVPVRVTYNPSYLLRNHSLSSRRALWEDMLVVMEQLGMPISEKQRGYFK